MKTRLRRLDLRGRMIPIATFLVGAGHAIAGDVKCVEVNGTLFVEGSAGADAIDVRTAPDGSSILVTGAPGTTVNGSLDAASFGGIESVRISMKGGDNVVSCSNLVLDGDLRYQGGKKTDALTIEQCSVNGMVKIATGAGNDTVIVDGSTVVDQLRLDGTSGDHDFRILDSDVGPVRSNLGADRGAFLISGSETGRLDLEASNQDQSSAGIFGSTIHGDLDAKLGAGLNGITVAGSTIDGRIDLRGGNGPDFFAATNTAIAGDVRLMTKNGPASAVFADSDIGGVLRLVSGAANDSIQLQGTSASRVDLALGGGANTVAMLNLSSVAESLEVTGGAGVDSFTSLGLTVGGDAKWKSAGGNDVVSLKVSSFESDLTVLTGAGNDQVDLLGSTVAGATEVDTGSGDDTGP